MSISKLLEKLISKQNLTMTEMQFTMQQMMAGQCSDVQAGAFLVALRCKGEIAEELIAAVAVLRSMADKIEIKKPHSIDIVGTGGDGFSTFNISTACSFVVAAAGGVVAKHGNRSASSKSGAADVLEAAGVNLDYSFEHLIESIEKIGFGFMFAPKHHAAMKNVIPVRKALKIRTIFNLLGPLTNPANASHHLIGVYDKKWLHPFAKVLQHFGSKKALILHAEDGLDEISLNAKTEVVELNHHQITAYTLEPEMFGITKQSLQPLRVNDAEESLTMIKNVFAGESGPAFDIVSLNAGAALYAADLTSSIAEGVKRGRFLLESGKVQQTFQAYLNLQSS